MNNILRPFFVALAVSIWYVSVLLIPGMMPAMGAEDDDSGSAESVQLSSVSNIQQLFRPGRVAKLVYHIRSYVKGSQGIDHAITYVPQGKLGKKCSYGYTFYDIDADTTFLSGFFVACKKAKDIYIVFETSRNPSKKVEVQVKEFKMNDDAIYSKAPFTDESYSTPWELYALSQMQIDYIVQSISSFEESEMDKKRLIMFSKFISKSFADSGEKGVKNAIKKSKKYTFSDDSEY